MPTTPDSPSFQRPLLSALTACAVGVAAFIAFQGRARAVEAFALKNGDRVVFYGDSITQDGGYASLVEEYARNRFPSLDLHFYNAGVGGDTVRGGGDGDIDLRLQRDVIRLKPTVVTIMLGMNDGGYRKLEPATLARFTEGYRSIVARIREALPGVRVYLIRSSPFDDYSRPPDFEGGYDAVLRQLGAAVSSIGAEQQVTVVDFDGVVSDGITTVFRSNPELARHILPDRVHPSPAGHIVMGAALLRAWGAPALVSRVEIDVGSRAVSAADNARVSALAVLGDKVTWTEVDSALPLPLDFNDANTQLAQLAGANVESLDSQPLVLRGLSPGKYEVRIDDRAVGTFSSEDLAHGINLARYNTPMRGQAYLVRWSADEGHMVQRLQRDLLFAAGENQGMTAAADVLGAWDERGQSTRSGKAVPAEHHFAVAPVR